MGIFDRLGRVARSEVTEMKRVLREAREERRPSGDPWDDQASYAADIAAADAELARDLGDPLSDVFARELAVGSRPDDDMARGASLWGQSAPEPAPSAAPTIDAKPVAPGWVDIPNPWARAEPTAPRPGRTETFPREVREAYAVLELPLGADRSRIEQAFRALVQRYHPDLHAGQPDLQKTATELTIKLRDARELLFAWLEGRR